MRAGGANWESEGEGVVDRVTFTSSEVRFGGLTRVLCGYFSGDETPS